YEAYTFGARLLQPARTGVLLHGVALAEPTENGAVLKLALSPDAGRILETEEAADAVASGRVAREAVCGVSGQNPQATGTPVLVQFGERIYPFCRGGHAV